MDPLSGKITCYDCEADSGIVQLSKESIASLWRQFKKRWVAEKFEKINFEFDPVATLEKHFPKGWYSALQDKPLLTRGPGAVVEEAVTAATLGADGKIVTMNPATVDASAPGLQPVEIVTLQSKGRVDRFVVWAKNVGGKILFAAGVAMVIIDVSNMITDMTNPVGQGFIIENVKVGQPVTYDGGAKFDGIGELSLILQTLREWKYSNAWEYSRTTLGKPPHVEDPEVAKMAREITKSQIWSPRQILIRTQGKDQPSIPPTSIDMLETDGPNGEQVIVILQLLDISTGANMSVPTPIVAGYYITSDQGKTWKFVRLVPKIAFKKGVLSGEKLFGGQDLEFEIAGISMLKSTAYMNIVRMK
jgi:hypothetical protein